MTPFDKGAETTLQALRLRTPLRQKLAKEDEFLLPTYRATPWTVLFGRYRDTAKDLLKKLNEKAQGTYHKIVE